jgi:hypothetical protein
VPESEFLSFGRSDKVNQNLPAGSQVRKAEVYSIAGILAMKVRRCSIRIYFQTLLLTAHHAPHHFLLHGSTKGPSSYQGVTSFGSSAHFFKKLRT